MKNFFGKENKPRLNEEKGEINLLASTFLLDKNLPVHGCRNRAFEIYFSKNLATKPFAPAAQIAFLPFAATEL